MSSTASAPAEPRRATTRPGRRPRRPDGLERLRVLLAGAMGAVLIGYALLVPVAALLLASGGSGSTDRAFAIAIPMWLAAHQIPIEVDGRPLGLLPLMPTLVVVLVVAAASRWSVRRLGGRLRHDAGAVVAAQAGAAAAVAVLAGALLPREVGVAAPWASMVGAGLLAGLAAGAGVLGVCRLPPAWTERLHGWPRAGVDGARAGAIGLGLSGALVLFAALTVRSGAVAASFSDLAPGAGAGAGVLVLAVGYLPNALVAGVSWALGPGLAVGAAQYGPLGTVPGPVPPFPLFAALPTDPAPAWTVLVLVLPLGAGVAVGRVCRRALGETAPLRDRLAAAGSGALVVAVGVATVAALAGGSPRRGPFDPVSLSPAAAGAAALVLLGVPATIACAGADELLGRPPARPVRTSARASGSARPRTGAARRDASARVVRRERGTGSERRGPGDRPRTVGDLVAATERSLGRPIAQDASDGDRDAEAGATDVAQPGLDAGTEAGDGSGDGDR